MILLKGNVFDEIEFDKGLYFNRCHKRLIGYMRKEYVIGTYFH